MVGLQLEKEGVGQKLTLAVSRSLVQSLHMDGHSLYGCQATPVLRYLQTVASWHSDLGGGGHEDCTQQLSMVQF
jgi:hypothetical protein